MQFCYDVLDKTAVQGGQPTVTIDRIRLQTKKDKEVRILPALFCAWLYEGTWEGSASHAAPAWRDDGL